MKINDIHYVHIFGSIEITVSENAIIEKLLKEADMSNDNNQNENIKNDKFSLYTEKINPKKPKKKNGGFYAQGAGQKHGCSSSGKRN